ncbi:MAG: UMP kinase [Patescibacteria group bacterium]
MPTPKPPIVISLGGSLVVPEEIEVGFLKAFKKLIEQQLRRGQRFILIIGGGRTARRYQHAARKISTLTPIDLDWLGIHATRLNAHLLRTIFRKHAYPQIITDRKKINPKIRSEIIVAAGFKPGSSTDYDAVLLAKAYGAQTILNLSNIDWVYDADPRKKKNAKPIKRMSWKTLVKLVGTHWDPGAHVPFDPVASKWAAQWGMKVIITRGSDLANLKKHFVGQPAKGTTIE